MTSLALGSLKGSPGVTAAAAALLHVWPADRDVVLVEADPAGGELLARWPLASEPGLATLAAAARHDSDVTVADHLQHALGVTVLAAPLSADACRAALRALGPRLPPLITDGGADVVVDCGRLHPDSAALPVAASAALTLLVLPATAGELHRLACAQSLLTCLPRVAAVLVVAADTGQAAPTVRDVEQVAGIPAAGVLARDPRAAAILLGAPGSARTLARSPLVRSARDVLDAVTDLLADPAPDRVGAAS